MPTDPRSRPPHAAGVPGQPTPRPPADSTGPGSDTEPTLPAEPLQLSAGAQPLPGYRLVRLLGRGGYGEVWEALGPGGFPVAMKFVRMAGKVSTAEQRALELMKTLRHPNLLALHGTWQQADCLILAMELADGTLLDRLRQAVEAQHLPGIPLPELLRQMHGAAEGLDYLNAQGVQHRDVKPHNLLLVGGGVKVGDFGLAKLLQETVATASGAMTPAYASPEACSDRVSRWSDQYSLAVTYCHLRGSRLPFEGSLAALVAGHLMGTPNLEMVPTVEERQVLARALAKQPQERWPSCAAFVAALASSGAASPEPLVVPRSSEDSESAAAFDSLAEVPAIVPERGWTLVADSTPRPVTPPAVVPVSVPLLPGTVVEGLPTRDHATAPAVLPGTVVEGIPTRGHATAPPAAAPPTVRGREGSGRGRFLLLAFLGGLAAAVLLLLGMRALGPTEQARKPGEGAVVKAAPQPEKEDRQAPDPPRRQLENRENKAPIQPLKEIEKEKKKPLVALAKQLTNSIGMKLVLIPPGKFTMGSPRTEIGRRHDIDNELAHEVEITKPFYLGQHEVKVGQFTAFVTASGYRTEGEKAGDTNGTWRNPGYPLTPRHPVVGVTWNDALSFCEWLSEQEGKTYRLPTEAEWEYSCRAGTRTRFYGGDDEAGLKKVAHYAGSRPQSVEPNAFGLYDMHGNVWEWCQDWYEKDYYRNSPKVDPQGPVTGAFRVMRGGSFRDEARHCRAAYRDCFAPSRRTDALGFRVVCVP